MKYLAILVLLACAHAAPLSQPVEPELPVEPENDPVVGWDPCNLGKCRRDADGHLVLDARAEDELKRAIVRHDNNNDPVVGWDPCNLGHCRRDAGGSLVLDERAEEEVLRVRAFVRDLGVGEEPVVGWDKCTLGKC